MDDILTDVKKNIIEQWDYSSAFPAVNPDGSSYTGPRGCLVVNGWPWQTEAQLMSIKNGQLTMPIVSIMGVNLGDQDRTLGDIYQSGVGSGTLQLRLGRRAAPTILISCWADQQLGGMDMSRKIAGHVFSAIFANRNSLTTLRGLRVVSSHESFNDPAMLYRVDLTVTGRALVVTDV